MNLLKQLWDALKGVIVALGLNDRIVGFIRTAVPVGVGAALVWLGDNFGIVVPEDATTGLILGLTAVVTSVYYAVVQYLAKRWPWVGILLGSRKQPTYTKANVDLAA